MEIKIMRDRRVRYWLSWCVLFALCVYGALPVDVYAQAKLSVEGQSSPLVASSRPWGETNINNAAISEQYSTVSYTSPTTNGGKPAVSGAKELSTAAKPVRLFIRRLHCRATTEMGHDGVYLIVVGKDKNGSFTQRLPADAPGERAGHWSFKPQDNADNITLWNGTLADGESVNLVVIGMEEDGSRPGDWATLGGAALSKIPDPRAALVGKVVGLAGVAANILGIENPDDFLGQFSISVTNIGGRISVNYSLGEGMADTAHQYVTYRLYECTPTREFWLNASDKGQYFVYIRTDPVDESQGKVPNCT